MKLGLISLGCPKNTVDTECMLSVLSEFTLTANPAEADVIIINTCAFLKAAREESRSAIGDMLSYRKKNPGLKIVVAGCYVSKDLKVLCKKYPEIHGWVGINDIENIGRAVREGGIFASAEPFVYKGASHTAMLNPYSAYVKISEGCNHRCSFCAIPGIKGRYRSRAINDITAEVKRLVENGTREVNLISQDLAYYGADIYGGKKLPLLLKKILASTKRYFWLRLLYLYPDEDVIKKVAGVIASDSRVCAYADIPFQHVSSKILKSMKRGYDRASVERVIKELRNGVKGVVIRSSFIAGYPGETEADFRELKEFISSGAVDKAGVFEYSDENGTAAYLMKGKNSRAVIRRRAKVLMLASARVCEYNDNRILGTVVEAIITGKKGKKNYAARTKQNAPDIDGYLRLSSIRSLKPGDFVKARLTGRSGSELKGEVL